MTNKGKPARFKRLRARVSALKSANRQALIYAACSAITTLGELALGWLMLLRFPERIVMANTISLVIGAALHYYLTAKYAFRAKHSFTGAGVYAATFVIGLIIQNLVIWAMYHKLLSSLQEGAQYLLSKLASMGAALVVVYLLRDYVNRREKARERKDAPRDKKE